MSLAILAPLTGFLLGYGVLRGARTPWPHLAVIAAGPLVGMPLVTLLDFGLRQVGLPPGVGLAWGLLALAALVAAAGLRVPTGGFDASRDLAPLLASLAVLALVVVHLLDSPTPAGDGIGNFAMKARFFHAEGTVWTFLRDGFLRPLHLDYPLHVPLGMNLGYRFAGSTAGLAGLAADAAVVPAAALFAGVMASRGSRLGGALVPLLLGAAPCVLNYATVGYADPPLAGLFLVGGVALAGRQPAWLAAGLAAGLCPWVKLEGLVLGGLLGLAGLALALRRRRLPLAFLLTGGALGACWPLTLWLADLAQPVAEEVAAATAGERARALLHGFGRLIVDPREAFGFVLAPAILAALVALRRPGVRIAAALGLAVILLYPPITWLRNTALVHLSGGVPIRLYLQALPLLLYVLGATLGPALRGGPRVELATEPPTIRP